MCRSSRALYSLLPLLGLCAAALPAQATGVGIPSLDGQPSHLELRVVSYNGGTNGAITVEVSNRGQSAEVFETAGLFFVPEGSPNEAPQRLGAVGPFQVQGDDGRKDKVSVPPGGRVVANLDVYCIDSHRRSPNSSTKFHLATTRMPRDLRQSISNATQDAAKPYGGVAAPAAKGAVQSEVWKNRDKKWIKLEGEGEQERNKSR